MRLIIAGSRNFNDYEIAKTVINEAVKDVNEPIEVVSGRCLGADMLGERYAKEHGFSVRYFPANWDTYGRSAGPRRNREMAEYASKDNGMLIAFWNGKSKGTKSMVEYAELKRLAIKIHYI